MVFEQRPIREETPADAPQVPVLAHAWSRVKDTFGLGKLIVLFLLLVIGGGLAAAATILDQPVRQVFTPRFLSPLDQDGGGRTNLLFLGVGGAAEQGGYLTDSIMIASIDDQTPSVTLVSIPRDTLMRSRIGNRKVNRIYADSRAVYDPERALEITEEAIGDFAGIDIHYAAVVDFRIFEEFVDSLGGIEIDVPRTINDPLYPAPNYQYQRFYIRKGLQVLDGDTALKYARSRQTTSDFDRAERQQLIIMAIKEKATSLALLTDMTKLSDLWDLFQKRVNTDLNLTELVKLARVAKSIDRNEIMYSVLNDDPNQEGGLMVPGDKASHGGAFVLLPRTEAEKDLFFSLHFESPDVLLERTRIGVYNAGAVSGMAGRAANELQVLGFDVVEIENWQDGEETLVGDYVQIASDGDAGLTAEFITQQWGAQQLPKTKEADLDIDLYYIIGAPKSQPKSDTSSGAATYNAADENNMSVRDDGR